MATLSQTLRSPILRRGAGGVLTEETPEEIQALAGQAGLQAPPITAIGAGMIGATPEQQKMMGTPAQKQAALTLAGQPEVALSDILRRRQEREAATAEEAAGMEKSEEMQRLGGLGDRVSDFINIQRQKLQQQVAPLEVKAADQFQGKDVSDIKNLLTQLRANPTDQNLMLQLNQALGYDINRQLAPDEINQLYESTVESIARGGAGSVDDDLTVEDLTKIPDFGYDTIQLSQLLGMPPDQITNLSVGDLRAQIERVATEEFARTQALEERAVSGQLGVAERALARTGAREASRVGVRASEADIARLEEQISRADVVQFAGRVMQVDELLKDETISGIISDYINSAPGSEIRQQIDASEPALRDFIQKNQEVLADASQALQAGAGTFQEIQKANTELQTAPFGGVKLDDTLARELIPGWGTLQATRIDPSQVPLLQYATSVGPEAGQAISNELNLQVSRDPEFVEELKQLTADDLEALNIEGGGQNWVNYTTEKQNYEDLSKLDPSNTDALVTSLVGGVTGAADAQAQLSGLKGQSLVFGGGALNIIDTNGDGIVDSGDQLKKSLLAAYPKPSLRGAAAGEKSMFTKKAIPPPKSLTPLEQGIMRKLGDLTEKSYIGGGTIARAGFDLDELIHLESLRGKGGNMDWGAITKLRQKAAVGNARDNIIEVEQSGKPVLEQINTLLAEAKRQGNKRLDRTRVGEWVRELGRAEATRQAEIRKSFPNASFSKEATKLATYADFR